MSEIEKQEFYESGVKSSKKYNSSSLEEKLKTLNREFLQDHLPKNDLIKEYLINGQLNQNEERFILFKQGFLSERFTIKREVLTEKKY